MHTVPAPPVTVPDPRPAVSPYCPLPDRPWAEIWAAAGRILSGLPAVP